MGFIFVIFVILIILMSIYCYNKFINYGLIKTLRTKNKYIPFIILGIILLIFSIYAYFRLVSALVIFLHYFFITLIIDLISKLITKLTNKEVKYQGLTSVVATVIVLSVGCFFAYYIFETKYTIYSNKINEDIRIVQITDSHLGLTVDGNRFSKYIDKIKKLNPDILVITGDYVDDDTSKEDMLVATSSLAKINPKYGKYFVYGNHDRGYYAKHNFTEQELINNLEASGVIILKDENVLINNSFYIIGREDRSISRKEAYELTKDLDKSKYMIMLNHQPNDYDNEVKSNADLVLSGHTHGGHLFPANIIGKLINANDMIYGMDTRDNTTFIVSSGISGWAIPFKTCAKSEYVVIDIKKK